MVRFGFCAVSSMIWEGGGGAGGGWVYCFIFHVSVQDCIPWGVPII